MKKCLFAVALAAMLLGAAAWGEGYYVTPYVGYGRTVFNEWFGSQVTSDAAYWLAGLQATTRVHRNVRLGIEGELAARSFRFECKTEGSDEVAYILNIDQRILGAVAQVGTFRPGLSPYVRVGVGLYTGSAEKDWSSSYEQQGEKDETIDLKANVGFNMGAGMLLMNEQGGGIYLEMVYHSTERSAKDPIENIESSGANNWAVRGGFTIAF